MKKLIRKLADRFGVTKDIEEETYIKTGRRLRYNATIAAINTGAYNAMRLYGVSLCKGMIEPTQEEMESIKEVARSRDAAPQHMNARRSGNTTRIIDACVQELFTTGTTRFADHYKEGKSWKANDVLLNRLLKRLWFEHGLPSKNLNAHNGTLNYPKILFEKSKKA